MWYSQQATKIFLLLQIMNAGFFLLSSLILFKNRRELTYLSVTVENESIRLLQQVKAIYADMDDIFRQRESKSLLKMILVILVMNTLGGAVGGIYHFYLLDHTIYHLSYAQAPIF